MNLTKATATITLIIGGLLPAGIASAGNPPVVGNFGKCISAQDVVALRVESTPGHGPSGPGVFFYDPELDEVVDSPLGALHAVGHAPFVSTMACGPDSR